MNWDSSNSDRIAIGLTFIAILALLAQILPAVL
jgi:hypothetical protein